MCKALKTTNGNLTRMRPSHTPFLREDHKDAPSGKATKGPVTRCPSCFHTLPGGTETWPSVEALEADEAKHKKRVREKEKQQASESGDETE